MGDMPKRPATVRARGLGAELRELRNKTGLSTQKVAQQLGWSASTLNRIENGGRNISGEDVSALLVLYEVTGQERDRLLELAREADQPGWWERASSALPPQLTALIGFESEAIRITDMSLALIPGLLQIPEYTRALLAGSGVSKPEIETLVVARLGRQALLSKPNPPQFLAILDEAVLRRPVGGRDVMAAQLRHIITASQRPNVTVQVIPFGCGVHAGLNGSYLLLEFTKARTLVHLEHLRSGIFVDEPDDVNPFTEITKILQETALGFTYSAEFLTSIATEYER
jgi:transcriptional regulator with XRE-family HTH domain